MHLFGADLHLKLVSAGAHDRGVERLVAVARGMAMKSLMRPGTGRQSVWINPKTA